MAAQAIHMKTHWVSEEWLKPFILNYWWTSNSYDNKAYIKQTENM